MASRINFAQLKQMSGLKDLKNKVETGRQLSRIPLSQIVSKEQVRKSFTGIEELSASFKEFGQQSPIVVLPAGNDGKYVILQGERRYRAAVMAGWTDIEAIITNSQTTEIDRILSQLTENVQRDDMKPLELTEAFVELAELGLTGRDIARRLGLSETFVSLYLNLGKVPDWIREHCDSEKIKDGWTIHWLIRADEIDHEATKAYVEDQLAKGEGRITRAQTKKFFEQLKASKAQEGDKPVKKRRAKPRSYFERIPEHPMTADCRRIKAQDALHVEVHIISQKDGNVVMEEGYLTPNVTSDRPGHVCVTVEGKIRSVPCGTVTIAKISPASEISDDIL